MRLVKWTDQYGYKHRSLVRDADPDDMAEQGIRQDPPSLDELDWEGVKRDLHNSLVDMELTSWREVQQRGGIPGAILGAVKRRLISLYREAEKP